MEVKRLESLTDGQASQQTSDTKLTGEKNTFQPDCANDQLSIRDGQLEKKEFDDPYDNDLLPQRFIDKDLTTIRIHSPLSVDIDGENCNILELDRDSSSLFQNISKINNIVKTGSPDSEDRTSLSSSASQSQSKPSYIPPNNHFGISSLKALSMKSKSSINQLSENFYDLTSPITEVLVKDKVLKSNLHITRNSMRPSLVYEASSPEQVMSDFMLTSLNSKRASHAHEGENASLLPGNPDFWALSPSTVLNIIHGPSLAFRDQIRIINHLMACHKKHCISLAEVDDSFILKFQLDQMVRF